MLTVKPSQESHEFQNMFFFTYILFCAEDVILPQKLQFPISDYDHWSCDFDSISDNFAALIQMHNIK